MEKLDYQLDADIDERKLDIDIDIEKFLSDAYIYEEESDIDNVSDYEKYFKELLLNIYSCYTLMITDKKLVPCNDENKIRDILLFEYLNDDDVRKENDLLDYLFDSEVPIKNGRIDIKIQTKNTLINQKAYYIIECKRLDGYATLNKKYVKNGINRFISKKYPSYYGLNGMIGFVVRNIDIDKNIYKIGNFFNIIEKNKLYDSNHSNLKLYHLMMDFSKNLTIIPNS